AEPALRAQDKKEDKLAVRRLKFMPDDNTVVFLIGRQSKLTMLEDAAAVEKLVGKKAAKAIGDQVDFEREKIAFVSWATSGPPDGKLMQEHKVDQLGATLNFYFRGPPGDGPTATQNAFLIGESTDAGQNWKFVDGSGVAGDRNKLKQILPNLPESLKLPASQQ